MSQVLAAARLSSWSSRVAFKHGVNHGSPKEEHCELCPYNFWCRHAMYTVTSNICIICIYTRLYMYIYTYMNVYDISYSYIKEYICTCKYMYSPPPPSTLSFLSAHLALLQQQLQAAQSEVVEPCFADDEMHDGQRIVDVDEDEDKDVEDDKDDEDDEDEDDDDDDDDDDDADDDEDDEDDEDEEEEEEEEEVDLENLEKSEDLDDCDRCLRSGQGCESPSSRRDQ